MYYLACPVCKKKVSDDTTGYRCEFCNKSFGEAVPTYNYSFMLSDYTSKISVSCIGEAGEAVLGQPATVLMSMGPEDVKLITQTAMFKPVTLLLRASLNTGGA